MDTTVERLKVGTPVIIGSYGVNNDEPYPIVWLKASPNCDFITECAVDYLCFDAPERTEDGRRNSGNPDYRLSNIYTFLNSDMDNWFYKTHESDAPPSNVFGNQAQNYRNHYGFLYYFEDYELNSLQMQQYVVDGETLSSIIRLPTITDILDDQLKLKLFSKKGIRPKATQDCADRKGRFGNFSWESYMNFWLAGKQDGFRNYALTLGRAGYCERKSPRDYRRAFLDQLHRFIPQDGRVSILPVLYHGKDQNKISELLEQMVREDKEGLMVNLDVPYQCRRHNGILKVKRFYTMDLRILRCEEGSGRLAGTLGAFVLDYKGNEVKVGSGFTDEQRATFWQGKDDLPGLLCEVKYKEISSDKNTGAESLQFPVFVSIRTDKTEVSFG